MHKQAARRCPSEGNERDPWSVVFIINSHICCYTTNVYWLLSSRTFTSIFSDAITLSEKTS